MTGLTEKLINVKVAMLKNKPKHEVTDKYLDYFNEYSKVCRNVVDKAEQREVFFQYIKYMERKK
jgi:hypothetical protein